MALLSSSLHSRISSPAVQIGDGLRGGGRTWTWSNRCILSAIWRKSSFSLSFNVGMVPSVSNPKRWRWLIRSGFLLSDFTSTCTHFSKSQRGYSSGTTLWNECNTVVVTKISCIFQAFLLDTHISWLIQAHGCEFRCGFVEIIKKSKSNSMWTRGNCDGSGAHARLIVFPESVFFWSGCVNNKFDLFQFFKNFNSRKTKNWLHCHSILVSDAF